MTKEMTAQQNTNTNEMKTVMMEMEMETTKKEIEGFQFQEDVSSVNMTNNTEMNNGTEEGLDVSELKLVPKFVSLGKSQKYMNRILGALGWTYSESSCVPNEGHNAREMFVSYVRSEDGGEIRTPILKNEFGVFNNFERQDWAINSIRFILCMAWLRASKEERSRMIATMNMQLSHDTEFEKIPKSFAYINKIIEMGKFKEFMEFVGYEPTTIFSNSKYPLCWKLRHNAWKDCEWLKYNHNHRPNIVVNVSDYPTVEDAAAAVVAHVWRRLQPYHKVENDILRPLGIL